MNNKYQSNSKNIKHYTIHYKMIKMKNGYKNNIILITYKIHKKYIKNH